MTTQNSNPGNAEESQIDDLTPDKDEAADVKGGLQIEKMELTVERLVRVS